MVDKVKKKLNMNQQRENNHFYSQIAPELLESQYIFSNSSEGLSSFINCISPERISSYMKHANHDTAYAVRLYIYNLQLSSALQIPLHFFEILLRNAIDKTLSQLFTENWHINPEFQNHILNPIGLKTLKKAIRRVNNHTASTPPKGKVIAELSLDFWSNIFRSEYDLSIWQKNLHHMLPNMPKKMKRKQVQKQILEIKNIRNRIAHHEPILTQNVTAIHTSIINYIFYIDPSISKWVKSHTMLEHVIHHKPKPTPS